MRIEPFLLNDRPAYRVYRGTEKLGIISTYENEFHTGNCYLKFDLTEYDEEIAASIVSMLGQYIDRPMQVMLASTNYELTNFLKAGGFHCMRRCYEMEVTEGEMTSVCSKSIRLRKHAKGEKEYFACCELLYKLYAKNHELINPLTADYAVFCECVPETVYCLEIHGQVVHFAFTEENEIAYVGSADDNSFLPFIQSVVMALFARYKEILFECDDSNKTAMALKSLFATESKESFDTYIFKKY